MNTNEEKQRYSKEELAEFETIIREKLVNARKEVAFIKETLSRRNDSGTDNTASPTKVLEDGADTAEKESLNQLASRQMKFIQQLENALIRIKNGDGIGGTGQVAVSDHRQLGEVVAAQVVRLGIKLLRRSMLGLLDTALPEPIRTRIVAILESHQLQGVEYHALRTRQAGSRREPAADFSGGNVPGNHAPT